MRYYLSKNYKELNSAGSKAKTDIEYILSRLGYGNAGLKQANYTNRITGFIYTLFSVIKASFILSEGDILLLQYPFKKYYSFLCKVAHWKGARVITLIHDLGSFRRKKLTAEKEIAKLDHADALIIHNENMKGWLLRHGYAKPMICLGIFDYLSFSTVKASDIIPEGCYKVVYAGALSGKKNQFLYRMDDIIHNWRFSLYGNGFDEGQVGNRECFDYKGFVPSDQLIQSADGDFGLVWDGDSTSTCSGNFGEYLRYNNPHKTALYIRCHLPVIIWKEAALAAFVQENGIGICVGSLEELDAKLASVSREAYSEMRRNVVKISERLSSGCYTSEAVEKAEQAIDTLTD